MSDILLWDIGLLVALLTAIGGFISFLHRFEKDRFREKAANLQDRFELDLERVEAKCEADITELRSEHADEMSSLRENKNKEIASIKQEYEQRFKKVKEEADSEGVRTSVDESIPLVQEEKMVYVKYLYITPNDGTPVYTKYIDRIDENVDVYSEYYYVRFNKFSKSRNNITIRDRTSGVVDLTLIYPWRRLTFADEGSAKIRKVITQDLEGQDTYFTASTYYNGFSEGNEDISIRMEMDTTVARMVADFSSVVGFESLFTAEPDAYRINTNQQRTRLLGLEQLKPAVYHIEVQNLKKGEVVMLDFHVDWNYLRRPQSRREL